MIMNNFANNMEEEFCVLQDDPVFNKISGFANLLYFQLERKCGAYDNCENVTCEINILELAEEMNMSIKKISKLINELESFDLLKRHPNSNKYTVLKLKTYDKDTKQFRERKGYNVLYR